MEHQSVTELPNSPPHVVGVTDFRGETTTVVDPKRLFDIDDDGATDHIMVFDSDRLDADAPTG